MNLFKLRFLFLFLLLSSSIAQSQVFIPFSYWRVKKKLAVYCESGCYPTPNTMFTAALFYVPIGYTGIFKAISQSNPGGYDYCWGPVAGSGCLAGAFDGNVTYPLNCSPTTLAIDGSSVDDEASVVPTVANTYTCNVTDYGEPLTATSFSVQSFNPVLITSPVTSAASPVNICVTKTQALTGTGGLGTLTWSLAAGTGTLSATTGASTTYTAPGTGQSVQVQLTDPTTSMTALAYINVISTIALSPSGTIDCPVNSATFMQDPTTSAGTTRVANLAIRANCGVANYSVTASGGGSVSPTTVADNTPSYFTPAAAASTSTITFTDSAGPAKTATLTINNAVPQKIQSGWGYHTCVSLAHSSYGAGIYKLKCWGFNSSGQLGNGTTTKVGNLPTHLGYGLPFIKNTGTSGADMLIKDFAVDWNHTCAILSDNTVKCWGANASGQLGYDNTTQLTSPPATTVNLGAGTPQSIYAGGSRTCVVFTDNTLKCWGNNTYGALGQNSTIAYGSNNTTASMTALSAISVAGSLLTVQKVAISENNICVLTTGGFIPGPNQIYCWGYGTGINCTAVTTAANYCGELGSNSTNNWGSNATTNTMASLVPLNLGLTGGESIIDIAAGRKHFCVIVALSPATSGDVVCWGANTNGQLGINSTTTSLSNSTRVGVASKLTNVTSLALQIRSTCAVLSSGVGKCWGRNTNGQLLQNNTTQYGDGSSGAATLTATNPSAINFGTSVLVKQISGGYYFACGIMTNNFIKCWGAQYCGTGTTTTNNGCLLSGISATLSNNAGAPTMMNSRYIGDGAGENGDNLPYLNY